MRKLYAKDAAKITKKTAAFVMASIRQGTCPYGFGAKMNGGRWSYSISEKLLREHVGDEAVNEYLKEVSE